MPLSMKSVQISKSRLKEYLAERLAKNVLKSEISDLVLVLRYNALGGFEFLSDEDLFENLVAAHSELDLLILAKSDENYLYLGLKTQGLEDEDKLIDEFTNLVNTLV
jgi:hypothetical protein